MTAFDLSGNLDIRIVPVGLSREPVVIVDSVMSDWRTLREAAVRARFKQAPPAGFPGLRAPLPATYAKTLLRRLDPAIRKIFFADRDMRLSRFDCNFSLVTLPASELHPLQKIPHVDIARRDRVAVLHYLCPAHFGGTAFFRQRSTGLELVGPDERDCWLTARAKDLQGLDGTHGYPDDATPGYERIASFEARPDRLLIYRSAALHSGIIDRPGLLSTDPGEGRLTANFFVDYALAAS